MSSPFRIPSETAPASRETDVARVQILLVEDDRGDYLLTRDLLDECVMPFDLQWAPDFDSALACLAERSFDVCLVDFRLGASDGLELLRAMLARDADTSVIMLTGQSSRETDIAAMQAGAVDYLVKDALSALTLERSIRYATQRKRSELLLREREEALRRSEERYALAARGSNDGLWDWDLERGTVYFSPRWKELLGYRDDEISASVSEWLRRVHLDDRVALEASLAAHCRGQSAHFGSEHRLMHRDGSYRWFLARGLAVRPDGLAAGPPESATGSSGSAANPTEFAAEPLEAAREPGAKSSPRPRDACMVASATRAEPIAAPSATDARAHGIAAVLAQSRATRIAGSMTDITERVAAAERDRFKALHDPLTGLANRALFLERLHHSFEKAARRESYFFAVLFLDLDGFKGVNDRLGHLAGDRLLVEAGRRLTECLRPGDTVARFGGDEFAVVLDDMHHPDGAVRAAERIQQAFAPAFDLQAHNRAGTPDSPAVCIGTSIGIAIHARATTHATALLQDADTALYRAKARGKGCSEIFDAASLSPESSSENS